MVTFVLDAIGAAVAVSVELLEALAIVLAVGVSRRWRDALLGTAWAVATCAILAALVGPVVLASVPLDALRVTIGALLLQFGLELLVDHGRPQQPPLDRVADGLLRATGSVPRAPRLAEVHGGVLR